MQEVTQVLIFTFRNCRSEGASSAKFVVQIQGRVFWTQIRHLGQVEEKMIPILELFGGGGPSQGFGGL